jgi:hypothetical protein
LSGGSRTPTPDSGAKTPQRSSSASRSPTASLDLDWDEMVAANTPNITGDEGAEDSPAPTKPAIRLPGVRGRITPELARRARGMNRDDVADWLEHAHPLEWIGPDDTIPDDWLEPADRELAMVDTPANLPKYTTRSGRLVKSPNRYSDADEKARAKEALDLNRAKKASREEAIFNKLTDKAIRRFDEFTTEIAHVEFDLDRIAEEIRRKNEEALLGTIPEEEPGRQPRSEESDEETEEERLARLSIESDPRTRRSNREARSRSPVIPVSTADTSSTVSKKDSKSAKTETVASSTTGAKPKTTTASVAEPSGASRTSKKSVKHLGVGKSSKSSTKAPSTAAPPASTVAPPASVASRRSTRSKSSSKPPESTTSKKSEGSNKPPEGENK